MKVNQKGFGLPVVLLLIIVVGLIGAAGWYVLSMNSKKQNINQTNNTPATPSPESASTQTPASSGYTEFKDEATGISFSYPKSVTGTFKVASHPITSEISGGHGSGQVVQYDASKDTWQAYQYSNATSKEAIPGTGYKLLQTKINGKSVIVWGNSIVFAKDESLIQIVMPEEHVEGDNFKLLVESKDFEHIAASIKL